MINDYELGKIGEQKACDYLIEKGYELIDKNFRSRMGEIDLVVKKGQILVFVEVKLKTSDKFGTPEEMITPAKIGKVRKMAEFFLLKHPEFREMLYRIDTVCLLANESGEIANLNHYEDLQ